MSFCGKGRMRTLLKNSGSGFFFQGVSDWTGRLEEAFDFQCPERLVRFVRNAALDPEYFELVFAFDDPQYNLSLPLDERFGMKRRERRRRRPAHAERSSSPARRAGPAQPRDRLPPVARTCTRSVLPNRL